MGSRETPAGKQVDARWEAGRRPLGSEERHALVEKPSILTIETDCDKLDKCLDKIQGCIGQIEEL